MKQRPCLCFSTPLFNLDTKMLKSSLNEQPPEEEVVPLFLSLRLLILEVFNGRGQTAEADVMSPHLPLV